MVVVAWMGVMSRGCFPSLAICTKPLWYALVSEMVLSVGRFGYTLLRHCGVMLDVPAFVTVLLMFVGWISTSVEITLCRRKNVCMCRMASQMRRF